MSLKLVKLVKSWSKVGQKLVKLVKCSEVRSIILFDQFRSNCLDLDSVQSTRLSSWISGCHWRCVQTTFVSDMP